MDAVLILLRQLVVLPALAGLGTGFLLWIWAASLAADAVGVI
jgi:hypothetical protein